MKIVDREQDRKTRWIKEAIAIRKDSKEGHKVLNREEGLYPLPSLYDLLTIIDELLPYNMQTKLITINIFFFLNV